MIHTNSTQSPRRQRKRAQKTEMLIDLAMAIVEADGLILTSYEALIDKESQRLRHTNTVQRLGEQKTYTTSVVGIEPTLNFAILKVEDAKRAFPVSKLLTMDEVKAGQKVQALAAIRDGKPVFHTGEISELNSKECYQYSMTATMLQAKIELPDSAIGGPVFNEDGGVVAIYTGHQPPAEHHVNQVTPILELEQHLKDEEANKGKRHLLPIFLVSNIYESLKLKKSVKSPWTGFSVRSLTEEERELFPYTIVRKRYPSAIGVEDVWKGGPAEKLGILKDDLLLGFSYYQCNTVAEFQKWLYAHGVGFEVKLYFLRGGTEVRTVTYKIEERPVWAMPQ